MRREKESSSRVAEETTIYNVKEDIEVSEILQLLKEHTQDKKLMLRLLRFLKAKRDFNETIEGSDFKNLLKEEG